MSLASHHPDQRRRRHQHLRNPNQDQDRPHHNDGTSDGGEGLLKGREPESELQRKVNTNFNILFGF